MRLLGSVIAFLGAVGLAACSGSSEPATAGPPARMIVSGDAQTGIVGKPLAEPIRVRVVDASFRSVAGANVTFEVQGGGSLGLPSATTDDSGYVHKTWTLGTNATAPQTLVVRTTDGAAITAYVNATARADAPAKLRIVSAPTTAQNGVAFAQPPVVAVSDQYGNDVPAAASITASVAQGTLRGSATAATDAAGRATFNGLSILGKTGPTTITFTSNQGNASTTVTLTAGAPKRLEAASDPSVVGEPTSGASPLRIRVVDESGNPVPGATVTFNFINLFILQNITTDANGIATFFAWNFPNKVGTYTVLVTMDGVNDFAFQVISRVGAPAKIVPVDVPASIQVAVAANISARVTDASGNAVPGATVTLTPPLGGTVFPRTIVADENGVFETRLMMPRTAGTTRTQVALGGGVTQEIVITATAGSPSRIVANPATNTVAAGTPFAVRATAYDNYDNLVPDAVLTTRTLLGPGSGFITPTTAVTDVNGGFTFTVTGAAVAGSQLFTVRWVTSGTATTFVSNTTGGPLPGIYAYPAQELLTGATHVFSCRVLAFKSDGTGTQGVPITFSADPGQGTISGAGATYSTSTDVDGYASATWILPSPGTFIMKVSSSAPNLFANPTTCVATAF